MWPLLKSLIYKNLPLTTLFIPSLYHSHWLESYCFVYWDINQPSFMYWLSFFFQEQNRSSETKPNKKQPKSNYPHLPESFIFAEQIWGPTAVFPVWEKASFPNMFLPWSPLLWFKPQLKQNSHMLFNESLELLSSILGITLLFMHYYQFT